MRQEREIQKIQKVDVSISNDKSTEEQENNEDSNVTKTDIKNIKDFLKQEYGVSEECLKIN